MRALAKLINYKSNHKKTLKILSYLLYKPYIINN